MNILIPLKEGFNLVKDKDSGDTANLCFQCGLCSTTCPWNNLKPFLTHKLIRQIQFGSYELENEEWWWCTTCRKCVERCPRGVEIANIQKAVREIATEWNANPASIKSVATSLSTLGNPWQGEKSERIKWAENKNIKKYEENTDIFYYPCCTIAYDKRLTNIANSTCTILQKIGLNYGILGTENCCGESIKKAGNETVFRDLAKHNIYLFLENHVNKVLVNSPHCYITFKEDYISSGGNFNTIHLVQLLANLLEKGELKFRGRIEKRIIYHDPCYLGRYAGIYDEPRKILTSIPGIELIEFKDNRKNSLCCGGGGGRIFMETKKGERFSDIRLKEAISKDADILATACPYCILNFKDGLLSIENGEQLEVRDISELVCEVI